MRQAVLNQTHHLAAGSPATRIEKRASWSACWWRPGLWSRLLCVVTAVASWTHWAAAGAEIAPGANLALVAAASTSYVSPHETIAALNSGHDPRNSNDKRHGAYGNWPRKGTQWVQYEWSQPISTNRMEVYWFDDRGGVRLPAACRLSYWKDGQFVPVENAQGLGLAGNKYNLTTFSAITTNKLRLEFDSSGQSTGLLQWKVYDSGQSPNFAPVVRAGVDRVVVLGGKTWLSGTARDDGKPGSALKVVWSRDSGPGEVAFADAGAADTTATFSAVGAYVLRLSASDGQLSAMDTLKVVVEPAPPPAHLRGVHTDTYQINSPLWNHRVKKLITNWIPHCYAKCSDPATKEGGIENFTQAGLKLAGKPHGRHQGAVFANAWVHNTTEAMCVALMVDPQGDPEIIAAQKSIREKLDDWIPKLLSAQEPDGYLQTFYTLNNVRRWTNKHDHEGYLAGYFMESAIAHYQMTGRTDPRMYNAAKRLADCWFDNIGPAPKRAWYEGHQELEQALVRLARFVEEIEGEGKGRRYVQLARFLMDSRRDGEEYDQSHLPAIQQYEAVGHAVRAVYSYAGMADIAMETGDIDYHSAISSLWDNIVNKKYYLTGGVGSGETSEGFGKNYSLPNNAYCESCAGCGELFFQHKMNLIHHDARYADLYEETLYNAILGSIDLEGRNFTYTNPLDSAHARYPWHVCPCCVGNIPRTLLMLPTWMYARSDDTLCVNLFVGSTVRVGKVGGVDVRVTQVTDYPWSGKVSITLNPAAEANFKLKVRIPNRQTSSLYTGSPECAGLTSLSVNGVAITPPIDKGYASITRAWRPGDRIDLVIPMVVQRVKASPLITPRLGGVALRYGPLVYNMEAVDQSLDLALAPDAPLTTEWNAGLLGGVMVIKGTSTTGVPMTAIPNYVRNNRGGRSIVWMKQ